jgi:hypothetical protein
MSATDSKEVTRIYLEIETLTSEYLSHLRKAVTLVKERPSEIKELRRERILCQQLVDQIKDRKALLDRLASS